MSEWTLEVTVCWSQTARNCIEVPLKLPAGSRVVDALRASQVLTGLPDQEVDVLQTGVWGRKQPTDHVLRDGDRVELAVTGVRGRGPVGGPGPAVGDGGGLSAVGGGMTGMSTSCS